ncbi:hypothetical protein B5F10_08960 [Anaerotruncus colihominis]|uniref:Uncharacterized protein n=2 Tax=Anaerotruncus colihominis TaxID=169435 RepID=A0A1Y4MKT4_9FIRM|nr:hypothetical protein [Anaerotruncus colihominis]OUP69347.1 hypothetical protein B5F11_09680 [Anaerotruncus colihominis]OUP74112.1 hypothetical protein B5F10_08960 [Anaerotruncus colihominis]
MKQMEKPTPLNLHLRFNAANARHREAAEYLAQVMGNYKTALIAVAIEAYRTQHPYGIDYQELEEIRRQTYRKFQPKVPIQENRMSQVASTPIPLPTSVLQKEETDMMDQAIALYGLDEDDEGEF